MPHLSPCPRSSASPVLVFVALGLVVGCGGGAGGAATEPVVIYSLESGAIGTWSTIIAPHVPGLVKFDLAFTNGDHNLGTVSAGGVSSGGAGPDLDSFLLWFSDDDGPDPVAMSAKYVDMLGGSARLVTSGQDLQGTEELPIPRLGPTEIFVLSGFTFTTDGSNHHIRTLRITPFPDLGYVEVEYRDDSPGDDLYAATVLYAVVPLAGSGAEGTPVYTGHFDAALSFAGSGTATRDISAAVLHGFSLYFLDGDRPLERVSVDLDSTNLIRATFRDGSVSPTDDLVLANVSYVLVNPGAPILR